jgi:hypothetical protein
MTENVLCPCTTAPGISFTQPNLPLLLREIEALGSAEKLFFHFARALAQLDGVIPAW